MKRKKKQGYAETPELMRKLAESVKGRLPPVDTKRLIMLNIPYVIVFYLVDKVAWLYRHCVGGSLVEKIGVLFLNFQLAFENVMPSLHIFDLAVGIVGAIAVKLAVYVLTYGRLPQFPISLKNRNTWGIRYWERP